MALRVLLLLLAIIVIINLVMVIVGYVCNVNMYEKYGKQIASALGVLILLIVAGYIVMSILSLE